MWLALVLTAGMGWPGAHATVPPRADAVHLPVLRFEGPEDICHSWIDVQNVGREPSKAILVLWGSTTTCAPHCIGPLAVRCSGLIAQGASWRFEAPDLPSGALSGVLFSANVRTLAEIGADPGGGGIVADVLCQALSRELVGDCDEYRRFKKAYELGTNFAALPLDRAYGAPLVAEVGRACPGTVTKIVPTLSGYGGTSGSAFGGYDRVMEVSSYYATLIDVGAGTSSALYIQNGGPDCASVEVWFQALGACQTSHLCRNLLIAPGTTATVAAADCVNSAWHGSAWLRSSQPLAVAVDVIGRDTLMTYSAVPAELAYSFTGRPVFTAGSAAVYGPLLYHRPGWESRVHVQNLSSVRSAEVGVNFYDAGGAILGSPMHASICPRGKHVFALSDARGPAGPDPVSVRVESLAIATSDDTPVDPANISAVAEIVRDAADGDHLPAAAFAYELLPEERGYDWPIGSGASLIAVPGVSLDPGDRRAVQLTVANLAQQRGFTNVALYVFDQNGLVKAVCRQLHERQVETIDLAAWSHSAPALRGGALVSAVAWHHPIVNARGAVQGNWVNLGAVAVHAGADPVDGYLDGDSISATVGLPLARTDAASSPVPALPDPVRLSCPPAPPIPGEHDRWFMQGRAYFPLALTDVN